MEKELKKIQDKKKELEELAKKPVRIYYSFVSNINCILTNTRNKKDIEHLEKTKIIITQLKLLIDETEEKINKYHNSLK